MTRAPTLDRLLAAFEAPDPPREGRPPGLAAVLLALYDSPQGPALLYIRRAEGMRSHPGEISFPGGRVDPTDAGPLDAALREAHEEVGLHPSRVEAVAHVVDHLTYRGSVVCAYVGRVRDDPPTAPASPEEVADVFLVPVEDLLDPARYEARRIEGMPRDRRVHYWHVKSISESLMRGRAEGAAGDPKHVRTRTIWGITGQLTAHFLERACGWTPPAEARTVASVEEFVPRQVA